MSTIFSKIIAGEVPCHKVYEDDIVLAFLDISPLQPGHTLIIPKEASKNGLDCNPETLEHMIVVAQKIAQAQIDVIGCEGCNFIMNNGEAAGQEVLHTHLHVIPRYANDGVVEMSLRGEYQDGEAEKIAGDLSDSLN